MISPDQILTARCLLSWSHEDLASAAGVTAGQVHSAEAFLPRPEDAAVNRQIQLALERAGIIFTNGDEPGVKLQENDGPITDESSGSL